MSADPAMGEYLISDLDNAPGLGGAYNPVNLQTYHYAGNNPLKYTDPSGRELITMLIIGGATLFVIGVQTYREVKAKHKAGESGWSVLKDWGASVITIGMPIGEAMIAGAAINSQLGLLQAFLFGLTKNGEFDVKDFTTGFVMSMFLGAAGGVVGNDIYAAIINEMPYLRSLILGQIEANTTDWDKVEREFRDNYAMIRDSFRAEGIEMPETYEEFKREMDNLARESAKQREEERRQELENRAKGIKTLRPASE